MEFGNLFWALANDTRPHYRIALAAGLSESRLSRCLGGRSEFTAEERARLASVLGYPLKWLFAAIEPPKRAEGLRQFAPASL